VIGFGHAPALIGQIFGSGTDTQNDGLKSRQPDGLKQVQGAPYIHLPHFGIRPGWQQSRQMKNKVRGGGFEHSPHTCKIEQIYLMVSIHTVWDGRAYIEADN
jgi:hypothetical protein